MHLNPREIDKLLLHQAGVLAQKRLARGVRLNMPESVALLATQLLEFIRDGRSVAELMDLGRHVLGRAQVMRGVPELVAEVQVEGTFPDGTKLVTVHHPIAAEQGDLTLAFYGSFLPIPDAKLFERAREEDDVAPGELLIAPGEITINEGRQATALVVTNRGDRPIQVGSHYTFSETNRALLFDRALAYGKRLDVPAGTAVRFEPGETRTVQLVPLAGAAIVLGGNDLSPGPVNEAGKARLMETVIDRGFGHKEQAP